MSVGRGRCVYLVQVAYHKIPPISILAYKQQPSAPALFSSLIKHLESESYAAENQGNVNLYLSLEQPWKGWRRSEETGKKERVGGLDKNGSWTGDDNVKVAVWLQRNGRASRKV